jgi:hypothetical protein
MKDKFESHACDLKNEADCKEELDEEGLKFEEVEANHFEE